MENKEETTNEELDKLQHSLLYGNRQDARRHYEATIKLVRIVRTQQVEIETLKKNNGLFYNYLGKTLAVFTKK